MLEPVLMAHVHTENDVAFFAEDPQIQNGILDNGDKPSLAMSQENWEAMGAPMLITVAIWPGDQINGDVAPKCFCGAVGFYKGSKAGPVQLYRCQEHKDVP